MIVLSAFVDRLAADLSVWSTTRAAGFTAYLLLFVSMLAGLLQGSTWAKGPRRLKLNLIHQWCGWFGLLFGMAHGLVLVFDNYVGYRLVDILVPFAAKYERWGTGFGILSLYLFLLLVVSSDLMKQLGKKLWRTIHFSAFPAFILALIHGLSTGSDSGQIVVILLYAVTGGITALLFGWRMFSQFRPKAKIVSASGKS